MDANSDSNNMKGAPRVYGFLFLAFIFLQCNVACAENATTNSQLRKSVDFSYVTANYFLDIVRGPFTRNSTIEIISKIIEFGAKGDGEQFSVYYLTPVS